MASKVIPYNQYTQLQTGDVLIVDSFVPLVNHFAIVYKKDGVLYIAENRFIAGGLGTEPLSDYEKRRNITGFVRNAKTESLTDDYIQKKIIDCAPMGYQFLSYNCEDFVRDICDCEVGYDQRQKWGYIWLMVVAVIILLYFLFKSFRIKKVN